MAHEYLNGIVGALVGAAATITAAYVGYKVDDKKLVDASNFESLLNQESKYRERIDDLNRKLNALTSDVKSDGSMREKLAVAISAKGAAEARLEQLVLENKSLKASIDAMRSATTLTNRLNQAETRDPSPMPTKSDVVLPPLSQNKQYSLRNGEVVRTADGTSITLKSVHLEHGNVPTATYFINGSGTSNTVVGERVQIARGSSCYFEVLSIKGEVYKPDTQTSSVEYVCKSR